VTTKQLMHRQVCWSDTLWINYLICYQADSGHKPDALTIMKMSILVERMLMHWLTCITSSLCSRPGQLLCAIVSTQHPSLSPSDMAPNRPNRSVSPHTSMSQPDSTTTSQLWPHLTLSLSQDGDFLPYKGLFYVPTNQDIQLDILCSTTTLSGRIPWITKTIKTFVISILAPDGHLCH